MSHASYVHNSSRGLPSDAKGQAAVHSAYWPRGARLGVRPKARNETTKALVLTMLILSLSTPYIAASQEISPPSTFPPPSGGFQETMPPTLSDFESQWCRRWANVLSKLQKWTPEVSQDYFEACTKGRLQIRQSRARLEYYTPDPRYPFVAVDTWAAPQELADTETLELTVSAQEGYSTPMWRSDAHPTRFIAESVTADLCQATLEIKVTARWKTKPGKETGAVFEFSTHSEETVELRGPRGFYLHKKRLPDSSLTLALLHYKTEDVLVEGVDILCQNGPAWTPCTGRHEFPGDVWTLTGPIIPKFPRLLSCGEPLWLTPTAEHPDGSVAYGWPVLAVFRLANFDDIAREAVLEQGVVDEYPKSPLRTSLHATSD